METFTQVIPRIVINMGTQVTPNIVNYGETFLPSYSQNCDNYGNIYPSY